MFRRFVAVVLLLVLPLQLVWAAAAPYCPHETQSAGTTHFGHHLHKHQVGDQDSSAADQSGETAGANHIDCESCHLGAGMVVPSVPMGASLAPRDAVLAYHLPLYRSHTPSGIERPDIAEFTLAARLGGDVVGGAFSAA